MQREKKAMRSEMIKVGYEKAPHRALLRATGASAIGIYHDFGIGICAKQSYL